MSNKLILNFYPLTIAKTFGINLLYYNKIISHKKQKNKYLKNIILIVKIYYKINFG